MLQGKTAVVTGAAKGIGKAIALAFAKEGCNIVLNYHSSLDDETVQEIEACGVTCMPVQGDVSDFAFAADMMKKVKKELGSVDILVNNAGITNDMLLMRMTEEQFDSVIQTNLKGTFNMIRHASSIMLKQRSGAIINMSSVVGVMGNVGQANYAASKAGIIGLTKSTAKELAARGVTCKICRSRCWKQFHLNVTVRWMILRKQQYFWQRIRTLPVRYSMLMAECACNL